MPSRFLSENDRKTLDTFNHELVGKLAEGKDGIINQTVVLYKISRYDTETNLYGEAAKGKIYQPGIQIACTVEAGDFDCMVLAGRYTLLEQGALDVFFPLALKKKIGIILAGVFNSGILIKGVGPNSTYDYSKIPDYIAKKYFEYFLNGDKGLEFFQEI